MSDKKRVLYYDADKKFIKDEDDERGFRETTQDEKRRIEEVDFTREDLVAHKDFVRRSKRKKIVKLLSETDYTQMPDTALSPAQVEAFRMYRASLRQLLKLLVEEDPEHLEIPERPQ